MKFGFVRDDGGAKLDSGAEYIGVDNLGGWWPTAGEVVGVAGGGSNVIGGVLENRRAGHRNRPLDPRNPFVQGLVGWWRMTEGAGKVVRDWSGQNNHLALTNFTPSEDWQAVDGEWGLDQNITGEELTPVSNIEYPAGTDMTYICCLYPDRWHSDMNRPGNPGFWRSGGGMGDEVFNVAGQSNKARLKWGGSGWISNVIVPVNEVVWIAYVVRDAAFYKIYLDGDLKDEASHSNSTTGSYIAQFGWQWATEEHIDGRWIRHGLWLRALSAAEIKQLYHQPDLPLWTLRQGISLAGIPEEALRLPGTRRTTHGRSGPRIYRG